MPKIDVATLPFVARGGYPPPQDKLVAGHSHKRLGDEAGLTQFGVSQTNLAPGAFSSLRHWRASRAVTLGSGRGFIPAGALSAPIALFGVPVLALDVTGAAG